jgi:hypothetical protein
LSAAIADGLTAAAAGKAAFRAGVRCIGLRADLRLG